MSLTWRFISGDPGTRPEGSRNALHQILERPSDADLNAQGPRGQRARLQGLHRARRGRRVAPLKSPLHQVEVLVGPVAREEIAACAELDSLFRQAHWLRSAHRVDRLPSASR